MEYQIGIPTLSKTRAEIQIHRFLKGEPPYPGLDVWTLPIQKDMGEYLIYVEEYTPVLMRYWPVVRIAAAVDGVVFQPQSGMKTLIVKQ